jgi:hypothetical protein
MTISLKRLCGAAVVLGFLCLVAWTSAGASAADAVQQQANPADAILGDWKPADMDVAIRIFTLKGKYVGGVVKAANPQLVNTEMLRGIEYDTASGTWRGEIFAIKRGAFVPMTIRLTRTGFEMVAGSGIMSKTIEWVRVPPQTQSATGGATPGAGAPVTR